MMLLKPVLEFDSGPVLREIGGEVDAKLELLPFRSCCTFLCVLGSHLDEEFGREYARGLSSKKM